MWNFKNNDTCLCGVHCHGFVYAMSAFHILISALLVIGCIVSGLPFFGIFPLISFGLSVLVCWGNRYNIPCLLLPGLIVEIVTVFLFTLSSFAVIFYGFYIFYIHFEGYSETSEEIEATVITIKMGLYTVLVGFLCLVSTLFYSYFVGVFVQDYKYMKRIVATSYLPTIGESNINGIYKYM